MESLWKNLGILHTNYYCAVMPRTRQDPNAEWTFAEWTAANGPLPTHSASISSTNNYEGGVNWFMTTTLSWRPQEPFNSMDQTMNTFITWRVFSCSIQRAANRFRFPDHPGGNGPTRRKPRMFCRRPTPLLPHAHSHSSPKIPLQKRKNKLVIAVQF